MLNVMKVKIQSEDENSRRRAVTPERRAGEGIAQRRGQDAIGRLEEVNQFGDARGHIAQLGDEGRPDRQTLARRQPARQKPITADGPTIRP